MVSYYPVTLNLGGKKAVVVGGGKVAERKIAGLFGTEADITVVSPEVTETIKQLSEIGRVHWLKKSFAKEDLDGAFIIFAATDDRNLNQEIKSAAGDNQLVTIADDPKGSDFHVPAQVQRGRLNLAISTGGASPILARTIRQQLEQEFDERYEDFLEFLFQARKKILQVTGDPDIKRKLLEGITRPEFLYSENREADLLRLYSEFLNSDKFQ